MLNYIVFFLLTITFKVNQAYSEHKHLLTFRVRRYFVMCTDCESAQQCTTIEGTPMPFPKLYPGRCSSVGMRRARGRQTHRQTDRHTHTDDRGHHTFRVDYNSCEMKIFISPIFGSRKKEKM